MIKRYLKEPKAVERELFTTSEEREKTGLAMSSLDLAKLCGPTERQH